MKVLLTAINAKYIHSNLAIKSIAEYSRQYKDYIETAEYTINNYTDYIIKDIYKKHPDVLMFSCYLWNISYVYEVSEELKKVLPDTDIWLGGPEVSYDAVKTLQEHPYIKGIMAGEGEQIVCNLMKHYVDKSLDLSQVRGILYEENGRFYTNPPEELLSMDELPFVYEDMEEYENKIIYYESSRGCPFGCSYCLSSIDKSVRFRSLCLVKKELKFFLEKKVPQVKFVDRTFNCRHDRTVELLQFLLENDNGVTNFHFEVAADLIREDEIEIMQKMRPGLIQLEIGVQSTNPATIQEIDRVMDFHKVSQVVCKINEKGNVHQHLDLIAGLPYETIHEFKQSFNDVYALQPEQFQLGFLKVLKGSKMYRNAEEYGIVYKTKAPYEVMKTKWMSYEDILFLKNVEKMVEVYYNSGQYHYILSCLTRCFDTPYDMYVALGRYYEEKGLFDIKHSRITRYTILKEFMDCCVECSTEEKEQLLCVLKFDLYLREKLKTRPEFFAEPDKESVRVLYNENAAKHKGRIVHIEHFDIDVQYLMQEHKIRKADEYVLFDYDERNPVNYQPKVEVL